MFEKSPSGLSVPSLDQLPPKLRLLAEHQSIFPYVRRLGDPFTAQLVQKILEEYALPGTKIVEIGSGSGEFSKLIPGDYKAGYESLEPVSELVEIQRRLYPESNIIQGDVYRMPYPAESVDSFVAMDVLDHLHKLGVATKSVYKALKPGGHFAHFHDRRPNLGFIVRHTLPDDIPFPFVDEGTRFFDRMQLLPRGAFQSQPHNPLLDNYVRRVRSNPDLLEQIRGGDFPEEAEILSALVRDNYEGHLAEVSSLRELFTRYVTAALTRTGFVIQETRNHRGSVIINDDEARLVAKSTRMLPRGINNRLVMDENGRWQYDGRVEELEEGKILLEYTINLIVAKKPERT